MPLGSMYSYPSIAMGTSQMRFILKTKYSHWRKPNQPEVLCRSTHRAAEMESTVLCRGHLVSVRLHRKRPAWLASHLSIFIGESLCVLRSAQRKLGVGPSDNVSLKDLDPRNVVAIGLVQDRYPGPYLNLISRVSAAQSGTTLSPPKPGAGSDRERIYFEQNA